LKRECSGDVGSAGLTPTCLPPRCCRSAGCGQLIDGLLKPLMILESASSRVSFFAVYRGNISISHGVQIGIVRFGLICVISLLYLLSGSGNRAHGLEKLDPVLGRMAKLELFAFGGVGFAMSISDGETDFGGLLSRPSAAADFQRLFAAGNAQAKCYALVGLRQLNRQRFEALAASLRLSKSPVATAHSCLMFSVPMSEIVARIQAGSYWESFTRRFFGVRAGQAKVPALREFGQPLTEFAARLRFERLVGAGGGGTARRGGGRGQGFAWQHFGAGGGVVDE
jgi:hypothetical protein